MTVGVKVAVVVSVVVVVGEVVSVVVCDVVAVVVLSGCKSKESKRCNVTSLIHPLKTVSVTFTSNEGVRCPI